MMDFKVEWVSKSVRREDFTDAPIAKGLGTIEDSFIPVVRLAEVETLIQEAEWAMEVLLTTAALLQVIATDKKMDVPSVGSDPVVMRVQAFLASVAAWRTGQEGNDGRG